MFGPGSEGRRTARGERFDATSDTAAHGTLPLGMVAEVTNLETGQSERVTIRDRGLTSADGSLMSLRKQPSVLA
ncbi:RlpA-like double-psi beta-barrel domain-containing protein [Siccirubricoccus deserti]